MELNIKVMLLGSQSCNRPHITSKLLTVKGRLFEVSGLVNPLRCIMIYH